MTNELRAVLDTNVLVSAVLLPHSVPRRVFDHVILKARLLLSVAVIAELSDVLSRPKFDRYISAGDRLEFLTKAIRDAESVEVDVMLSECRDPKDKKFLELAVSGSATHLVTGDADLLALNPFRGIAIVSPSDFLRVVALG
ncbi:MAG TPA: putative toxin-antitoxin system toxin component, PIN family [Planctomycetaceae bacterium]|nr:putative toxin-antitoxin system toxin component, PIN family [Planctomycetaceae bacterium]